MGLSNGDKLKPAFSNQSGREQTSFLLTLFLSIGLCQRLAVISGTLYKVFQRIFFVNDCHMFVPFKQAGYINLIDGIGSSYVVNHFFIRKTLFMLLIECLAKCNIDFHFTFLSKNNCRIKP